MTVVFVSTKTRDGLNFPQAAVAYAKSSLANGRRAHLRTWRRNPRGPATAQVHRLHAPLRHFSPQLFRDVSAFQEALTAAASHALPQVSTSTRAGKRSYRPCTLITGAQKCSFTVLVAPVSTAGLPCMIVHRAESNVSASHLR